MGCVIGNCFVKKVGKFPDRHAITIHATGAMHLPSPNYKTNTKYNKISRSNKGTQNDRSFLFFVKDESFLIIFSNE